MCSEAEKDRVQIPIKDWDLDSLASDLGIEVGLLRFAIANSGRYQKEAISLIRTTARERQFPEYHAPKVETSPTIPLKDWDLAALSGELGIDSYSLRLAIACSEPRQKETVAALKKTARESRRARHVHAEQARHRQLVKTQKHKK